MNATFRNLRPVVSESGEVVDADWDDVDIEGTLRIDFWNFCALAPKQMYNAVRAAAMEQARKIAIRAPSDPGCSA